MRGPLAWPQVVGALLAASGVVGFLTIADDLIHWGELLGVGTVLVVGVLLFVAGSTRSPSVRAAIVWLSGALAIGALAGFAIDDMALGISGGLIVGALAAAVRGRR